MSERERSDALVAFWDKGYNFGLETAIGQLRWQMEVLTSREMTGDELVGMLLDLLSLLVNLLESLKKPENSTETTR